MSGEKMHLVYATDKGFLMPTMVSAASAIAHARSPEKLVIDVLDCGLSDSEWKEFVDKLQKVGLVDIQRHSIDLERFSRVPTYRGNRCNYARFLIPEILSDVEWCVYADGDTLFLDDAFALEEYCSDAYALLGHKDLGVGSDRQDIFTKLGYKGVVENDCICSGFMLMNLKWFRENRMVEKLLAFLENTGRSDLYDQDALNILCEGFVKFLPPEWGVFNSESFESGRIPKCVHYAFGKPWNLAVGWTRCLLDVDILWFKHAKIYCGIGLHDAGATWTNYFKRYCRSVIHRVFLKFVCLTNAGKARWGAQVRYYSPVGIKMLVAGKMKRYSIA